MGPQHTLLSLSLLSSFSFLPVLTCSLTNPQLPAELDKFAFVILDQFQALFRGFSIKQLDSLMNKLKFVLLDDDNPYFFILSGGEQTSFLAAVEMAMPHNRSLFEYNAFMSTRIPDEDVDREWATYCEKVMECFGQQGLTEEWPNRARKNACLARGFFCLANIDQLAMELGNNVAGLCCAIIDSFKRDLIQTPMYWKSQGQICDIADGVKGLVTGLEPVTVRVPSHTEYEKYCNFFVDVLFCHYLSQMLFLYDNNVLWKLAGQ